MPASGTGLASFGMVSRQNQNFCKNPILGYEIRGLENLPDEGPALIIGYHGTLPLDLYYVIAKGILYKKRTIHCVGDKFVFKIPGFSFV